MLSRYPSLCITAALALAACESQPTAPLQIPLKAELTAAKVATARYRNLQNAIADGYVDIDVYMEGMGHHYMNESLLDERFDAEAPELLVYEEVGGVMTLVALEYAVPTAMAAEAPEGFTGTDDVWDNNTAFQLWTLHAWIWLDNPDGIFAPFNPLLMTGEP